MILQGVKLTIQPLGVGYANRPKKAKIGGYVAFSPIYACLACLPAWLCLACFSPYLGIRSEGGGGSPKGRVHNLLMQFFNPDSSKIEGF